MAARDRTARYSGPPAQLVSAIDAAVRKYPNVTRDELLGIWRIESGSTFPNPYRNSLGYGGLFGTTDWNGDPAGQAMYAASILSRLITQHQGDLGAALYAYSGGGYTSVSPGPAYGSRGSRPVGAAGGGGSPSTPSGGGFFSWVGHEADNLAGGITGVTDFLKAAVWLVNPLNWLRAAEFLVGMLLVLFGVYFYGTATSSSSPASSNVPIGKIPGLAGPAGAAVKVATKAKSARSKKGGGSGPRGPRRKGDAAAARGEEVTRTGPPQRRTAGDKVRERRNAAKRRSTAKSSRRALDKKYGDIPF